MTDEQILEALKVNLGITVQAYDMRLLQVIQAAKSAIIREGARSLAPGASVEDAQLVIMYAQWLWAKRDTMEAMPRMLRWNLNNRVFAEKAGGAG